MKLTTLIAAAMIAMASFTVTASAQTQDLSLKLLMHEQYIKSYGRPALTKQQSKAIRAFHRTAMDYKFKLISAEMVMSKIDSIVDLHGYFVENEQDLWVIYAISVMDDNKSINEWTLDHQLRCNRELYDAGEKRKFEAERKQYLKNRGNQ